jgi:hypothetical protein
MVSRASLVTLQHETIAELMCLDHAVHEQCDLLAWIFFSLDGSADVCREGGNKLFLGIGSRDAERMLSDLVPGHF